MAELRPPQFRPAPQSWTPLVFGALVATLWVAGGLAYAWGYLGSGGHIHLDVQEYAVLVFSLCVPPLLIIAAAWAFTRGQLLASVAENLVEATGLLFAMDESAARAAGRVGRTVRRELDGLNNGLDGALGRLRALEAVLEKQVASLDEAGARMDVRTGSAAAKLSEERERIDATAMALIDASSRAGETLAGRAAQLKSTLESAEGVLRNAGEALGEQAVRFRTSAESAAEAPHAVAVELDKQARRIESVSDAALARSEFILGRHERHRAAMQDMLQRLKDENLRFEAAIVAQQESFAKTVAGFSAEAEQFGAVAEESDRRFAAIVTQTGQRSSEQTAAFVREAETLRTAGDAAQATLVRLVQSLHDAGQSAQTLIGETAARAGHSAKALVGEAMAEGERLLGMASQIGEETREMKFALAASAKEVEQHLVALPDIARQEAQRVRDMVQAESEAILDLSARTISTIQARKGLPRMDEPAVEKNENVPARGEGEGLLALARRITQRQQKAKPSEPADKPWEMRALLTAVDGTAKTPQLGGAAALGALQSALSDLAIDLQSIAVGSPPGEEDWRLYLEGDRSLFARRLSGAIDADSVERISAQYRDNPAFREAADIYVAEFEALLAKSRYGDGNGVLTSTILGGDTGRIYLAVAYALGRLS